MRAITVLIQQTLLTTFSPVWAHGFYHSVYDLTTISGYAYLWGYGSQSRKKELWEKNWAKLQSELSAEELMLLNCSVGDDSWEFLGLQGDTTSPSWKKSVLNIHWKDWCCSWNSNTLATWCDGLTLLKRPWFWERLMAEREGDDRGWDGWMASPTQWTWVWVNSKSWWWTGRPDVLKSMGLQRVRHDWATELNWSYHLITHGYWRRPCNESQRW